MAAVFAIFPAVVVIIVFFYLPMYGITIAFRDYAAGDAFFALFNGKWVGFKHFKRFFSSIYFDRLIGNTLRLSLLNLVFGFTIPILFALLMNEVRQLRFKKMVQTASYLPYFISTVVVAGMVLDFIKMDGLVNQLLGVPRQEYAVNAKAFPTIYTITNVWKSFGFSSILYFSTISGIDATLYEAAYNLDINQVCDMPNAEEAEILSFYSSELDTYINEVMGSILNGSIALDEIDGAIDEIRSVGLDEVYNVYNSLRCPGNLEGRMCHAYT